jgi:hypothetical protein
MGSIPEIERSRRRLEAAFSKVESLKGFAGAEELQSHFARHLCVLVSGFVEQSIAEMVVVYSDGKSPKPLRAYVDTTVRRLTNVDRDRLCRFVSSFDKSWGHRIEAFTSDQRQSALNAVIGLRNQIAHGGPATVSLRQIAEYWQTVQEVVDEVERIFFPAPRPVVSKTPKK